jgi:hypothetical protein
LNWDGFSTLAAAWGGDNNNKRSEFLRTEARLCIHAMQQLNMTTSVEFVTAFLPEKGK